ILLLIPLLTYQVKQGAISAEKILKLVVFWLSLVNGIGLSFLIAGVRRLGKMVRRKPEPQETASPSRRDNPPPRAAALPPQSIQHPAQHSVTEATTGLLPQEVKRTNQLK